MSEPERTGTPAGTTDELRGPRVVVGVDFSPGSRAALVFAAHDAARRGVPVEVVSAYRPPDYWMDFYALDTVQPEHVRTVTLERLHGFAREVLAPGVPRPPEVRVRVVMGPAADVLLDESQGADLLVVGGTGHGSLTGMLLGSVSMHCALHASCPVTVVHSPEAHRERLHLRRGRRREPTAKDGAGVG